MTSRERHQKRYERRKAKREANHKKRAENFTLENVFNYNALFESGLQSCNGVRWKSSTQNFERHLFSFTADTREKILNRTWKPDKFIHFIIFERGKVREIDAPRIKDRQVHKLLHNNVLTPLYAPYMIYNNGAGQKGKGLKFTYDTLKQDLRAHYRRYGREGQIILLDFEKFFPTADHDAILDRHDKTITDEALRDIINKAEGLKPHGKGLPLGVELNQCEMTALPCKVDAFIKCQLHIKRMGHYMDDYYILLPPNVDAREVVFRVTRKAKESGLKVNQRKVKIQPLKKPFRFCKAKFTLTETGKTIVNGCRDTYYRFRRKAPKLKAKFDNGKMTAEQLRCAVQSVIAYYKGFDSHAKLLKVKRTAYSIFGEDYEIHRI